MDAILLFSHGSLLCGAGETLQGVAERLRANGDAQIVGIGYLNYSEPTFETTFARCVALGATRIVVVPYFLVAGKFVQVDLPRRVTEIQGQYPEIEILLADALGFHPLLADALEACAVSARPPAAWRETAEEIARVCRASPRCPRYDTGACPGGIHGGSE